MMAHIPMSRSMVRRVLRDFGLGRAIDSGAFGDAELDWVHALLRHTRTMKNDIRSSPQIVRPFAGQNDAVLFDDEVLARLTMPLLFLWGAHDPNGGVDVAHEFTARLPSAELIILPDAEHAPWLDDLAMCVDATRSFLTG